MATRCRAFGLTLAVWAAVFAPTVVLPGPKAQAAYVDEQIEEVYLTEEEALRITLAGASEVVQQTVLLSPDQRRRIEAYARRPVVEPRVSVYVGQSGGRVVGYAMRTEEVGMYKPITSMVGVTPEGQVREVAVMVYRESRGGDVRRRRFLNQYRGKTMSQPIRINQDIINVTGATLSVRSLNDQVRKALAIVHELFLQKGGP